MTRMTQRRIKSGSSVSQSSNKWVKALTFASRPGNETYLMLEVSCERTFIVRTDAVNQSPENLSGLISCSVSSIRLMRSNQTKVYAQFAKQNSKKTIILNYDFGRN